MGVSGYTTGIETNDTIFKTAFPYVQTPWSGYGLCTGGSIVTAINPGADLNLGSPPVLMQVYPNPAASQSKVSIRTTFKARLKITVYNSNSQIFEVPLNNELRERGTHDISLNLSKYSSGTYYVVLASNGETVQSVKLIVTK